MFKIQNFTFGGDYSPNERVRDKFEILTCFGFRFCFGFRALDFGFITW
jgi:hypothetical protein